MLLPLPQSSHHPVIKVTTFFRGESGKDYQPTTSQYDQSHKTCEIEAPADADEELTATVVAHFCDGRGRMDPKCTPQPLYEGLIDAPEARLPEVEDEDDQETHTDGPEKVQGEDEPWELSGPDADDEDEDEVEDEDAETSD